MSDRLRKEIMRAKMPTKKGGVSSLILSSGRINSHFFEHGRASELKRKIEGATSFLPSSSPIAERIYCVLNEIHSQPICSCEKGSRLPFLGAGKGYQTFCGLSCSLAIDHIRKKAVDTSMERYGTPNPSQSEEIKGRIKQVNLDRYGVEWYTQHPSFQERIKQINLDRYGVENVNYIAIPSEVIVLLNDPTFFESEYKDKGRTLTEIADDLGISPSTVGRYMRNHGLSRNYYKTSKEEMIIASFIKSIHDGEVIQGSYSVIPPKEVDIFIPEHHLAIEINGLYWHSENGGQRKSEYHEEKRIACEEEGIRLLQLYSSEVHSSFDIIQSMIRSKLGLSDRVMARKTKVVKITTSTVDFENENHLQGYAVSAIKYGLIYQNELIALMTFARPRFSKIATMELVRFMTKKNLTVVGGASKLLNQFLKDHPNETIITYSDGRYSDGGLYECLGFSHVKTTRPGYVYTDYKSVFNRMKFQKHKLRTLYPEHYSSDLTEWGIMQRVGFDRVWGCSNKVWIRGG